MSLVALSELLGAAVRDPSGAVRGRVREVAVAPQDHSTRVAFLIVRTSEGERILRSDALTSCGSTVRAIENVSGWERYSASDGVLLLKRDLLDQQIIDVHGRKVVRVNGDLANKPELVNEDCWKAWMVAIARTRLRVCSRLSLALGSSIWPACRFSKLVITWRLFFTRW